MAFTEALKKRVRKKSHHMCCLCKSIFVEVHHIVPQAEGGLDEEDNAAPLCPSHHEMYGANPEKRKFILEARDNWYEICAKRYASDPDRLDEIKNFLQKTATAEDLQKLREELTPRVVEIRASRMREFYEELEKGGIILTEDVVQLEDFFHCYSKTLTAVVNTRRRRKIRLFARLLTNSLKGAGVRDPEDYEFLLGVLDDLSLEDLAILKCIEEYEKVYYKNGQFDDNQGQRSSEGRLLELVRKRLGLTDAELGDQDLAGMVVRLNRSGCYLGLGWREGPAHDCRLTGIYYKLKRLILKEGEALGIARAQRP